VKDLFGDEQKFNYIDVSGVLHHLPDPPAALRQLKAVLDAKGGIGVMLYGKHGRTGVYGLQRMLRLLMSQGPEAKLGLKGKVETHLKTSGRALRVINFRSE